MNRKILERAVEALRYAIREADEWCDDHHGKPVQTPEMDDARKVLSELEEIIQSDAPQTQR